MTGVERALWRVSLHCVLGWEAALYAMGILLATGGVGEWGCWYSQSTEHRAQTSSLLHGQWALSNTPTALSFDLAWSQGGVQQVWGVGIPLWRVPFDLAARLLGQREVPERWVLGATLACTFFVVLRVWLASALGLRGVAGTKRNQPLDSSTEIGFAAALGAGSLLLLFPPFLSLLGCRLAVYEEVLVYVYLYGLVLVTGVVSVQRRPAWGRAWVVCALAGLGGLIRPTLVFYGASTLAVALALMVRRCPGIGGCGAGPSASHSFYRWRTWVAVGLFVAGGTVLYMTNLVRFGSGFEFGHRLNTQRGSLLGSVYATRFDHPFQEEPLGRAARELFGALFLARRFNGGDWYAREIFPGQSPTVRWREFYFTTYDLSYAVLVAVGWGAGLWRLGKWWRQRAPGTRPAGAGAISVPPLTAVLAVWSLLATLPLAGFYLYTPVLSSRYMMDFAPAFAVALVAAWLALMEVLAQWRASAHWPQVLACCAVLVWTGGELSRAECAYGPPESLTWEELEALRKQLEARPAARPLPARYEVRDDLRSFNIPFNGEGWNPRDGTVASCVILFVDSPEFLELDVASVAGARVSEADVAHFRAKVGLEFLRCESITRMAEGWRVRFAGPRRPRYQRGIQPVFIATVPKEKLAELTTPWRLLRVLWRSEGGGR